MNTELRFWAKVRKTSTCWLWTGGKSTDGYGRFWFDGQTVGAHRYAYELAYGSIPDGLQIDHLCRVHYCVRASHLEAVTCAVNIQRGNTGQHNANKTHCPQGHPYSGDNLRIRSVGRGCQACDVESMKRSYQRKRLAITV